MTLPKPAILFGLICCSCGMSVRVPVETAFSEARGMDCFDVQAVFSALRIEGADDEKVKRFVDVYGEPIESAFVNGFERALGKPGGSDKGAATDACGLIVVSLETVDTGHLSGTPGWLHGDASIRATISFYEAEHLVDSYISITSAGATFFRTSSVEDRVSSAMEVAGRSCGRYARRMR